MPMEVSWNALEVGWNAQEVGRNSQEVGWNAHAQIPPQAVNPSPHFHAV